MGNQYHRFPPSEQSKILQRKVSCVAASRHDLKSFALSNRSGVPPSLPIPPILDYSGISDDAPRLPFAPCSSNVEYFEALAIGLLCPLPDVRSQAVYGGTFVSQFERLFGLSERDMDQTASLSMGLRILLTMSLLDLLLSITWKMREQRGFS